MQKAEEVLEQTGMADRADQLARELSYGWQKTLTLAIGLAAEPKLLMLDEPITGIAPTRGRGHRQPDQEGERQGHHDFASLNTT